MQTEIKLNFADAMRLDMVQKELTEASVGKALGISQQAVNKWLERGFPPLSRAKALRELFGANSNFARLTHEDLFGEGQASRTPNPAKKAAPPPESPQEPPRPRSNILSLSASVREYAAQESRAFTERLPPALRRNMDAKMLPDGERPRIRLAYASDNIVAEVAHAKGPMWSQSWSSAILRLLLYRDLARPNVRAVFILVSEEPDRDFPALVTLAAKQYGVELVRAESGTQAAEYIIYSETDDLPDLAELDE